MTSKFSKGMVLHQYDNLEVHPDDAFREVERMHNPIHSWYLTTTYSDICQIFFSSIFSKYWNLTRKKRKKHDISDPKNYFLFLSNFLYTHFIHMTEVSLKKTQWKLFIVMLVTNIPSEQIPRDIKCAKPCILVNLAKDNYHSRNGDDSETWDPALRRMTFTFGFCVCCSPRKKKLNSNGRKTPTSSLH